MANDFSASFKEVLAKKQETVFYKNNVAMALVDVSYNQEMSSGDTLTRTYRQDVGDPDTYSPGTDITIDEFTDTPETLTVNGKFAKGFYVDDFDKIQNLYDAARNYGKDVAEKMSNKIDADILGEIQNALSTIDDGSIGGTSGNGITVTTSNILKIVTAAKKKLTQQDVPLNNVYMTVSPEFEEVLTQYVAGRDTMMGDDVNKNGFIGKFLGTDFYRTNQSLGSAVLSLATNPTDGDTITIEGIVLTFVSSIGTTAGNVLIGINVDTTRANLAGLINAPKTTSATQVALSTANARKFLNYSATNSNSADTLTVKVKGVGVLTVSETLVDATDTWTTAKIKQHLHLGIKEAITLVMQKDPSIKIQEAQKRFGNYVLDGMLYGYKTFADGAKQLVNIELNASAF